ncbi:MAG: exosortase [Chthonomonadales bacterium]|nr:exosortase [Chthonomonadales bacterium]
MDITQDGSRAQERSGATATWVLLAVAAGLTIYLYLRAINWWYFEWTVNGSYYAHGVFIPFFVAAMIWRDRERLRRLPVQVSWWGAVPLALAVALVMYAYRADVTVTLSVSFMLFLIGATLLLAGKRITRALLFPILFLLTMIPIVPNQVISQLAFPIQLVSAKLAASLLNLMTFHATRIGTEIRMDNYTLNVEVPCSGFKTLIGLLSFAGAFAYLTEAAPWKRWVLFLMAAPLSILVNGVRIALIGLAGELYGAPAAQTFHDWSGFIVLIIGFMVLFSTARLLKCDNFYGIPLQDPPPSSDGARPEPPPKPTAAELDARYGPAQPNAMRRLAVGAYPVVAVLAIAGVARGYVQPPKADPSLILRPAEIPVRMGGWQRLGEDTPITEQVKSVLEPDTYLDRNYVSDRLGGRVVNLFMTGGNSRRTFHDPHDCFMGSGYDLADRGLKRIDTPAGPVYLQESVATNPVDHVQQLIMFAYIVDGRMMQSMAAVHGAILRQTLLGSSSGRPFYFVRFRHLGSGAGDDRRKELVDFVRSAWPTLAPRVLAVPVK